MLRSNPRSGLDLVHSIYMQPSHSTLPCSMSRANSAFQVLNVASSQPIRSLQADSDALHAALVFYAWLVVLSCFCAQAAQAGQC